MNHISYGLLAALSALAWPAPAQAGELFGGIYKHGVSTPLSLEEGIEGGIDLQIGYRGAPVIAGTKLSPYLFGAINTKGDTSYAVAGLDWKFGDAFYVRPGVGLAIHNGSADKFNRTDRLAFGSRVLFAPELGIGARLSKRMTIEASWVHLSHAQLFGGQNPGIDNIGARFNLEL